MSLSHATQLREPVFAITTVGSKISRVQLRQTDSTLNETGFENHYVLTRNVVGSNLKEAPRAGRHLSLSSPSTLALLAGKQRVWWTKSCGVTIQNETPMRILSYNNYQVLFSSILQNGVWKF